MITVFTILFVVCCLVLCVLILLQSSKGGLGAGLGGGGSQSTQVFGGQGAGGFLSRWTIIFSVAFMTLSLVLAHLSSAPQSILGELDEDEVVSSEEDEIIEEGSLDIDPLTAPAEPADKPTNVDPIKLDAPVIKQVPPVVQPPAGTAPEGDVPADTKPVDVKPVDVKPVVTPPVNVKPVDKKPAATKPADTKPAVTKPPAETTP